MYLLRSGVALSIINTNMKKTLAILFISCLTLASCEKSESIEPANTGLSKNFQPDTARTVLDDIIPPVIPPNGPPK
jgi:hypothetical protein